MVDRIEPAFDACQPSAELLAFAEFQARNARVPSVDRRTNGRNNIVVPVLVRPFDHNLCATGGVMAAVTRDICSKAIGLLHEETFEQYRLLAIQLDLAGESVNVTAELVWCRPLGPFYYSACRFAQRLTRFPHGEIQD